jgi:hypothetical protein
MLPGRLATRPLGERPQRSLSLWRAASARPNASCGLALKHLPAITVRLAPGTALDLGVLTTSFLFVSSAQNGLASVLGQQHLMSGQVLGTALYDKYGNFFVCVIAVTVAYALILPMLLLVPKQLISTADGQKA